MFLDVKSFIVAVAKLPELFSVHFRREGVLHQLQILTDPDYTFSGSGEGWGEGGLNMSWSSPGPQQCLAESWTIAGSSFGNMLPVHLR